MNADGPTSPPTPPTPSGHRPISPGDRPLWIALFCILAAAAMLLAKPVNPTAGHGPMWYGMLLIAVAGAAANLPAGVILAYHARRSTVR